MPLPWALRGLRDGVVTTPYPRRRDPYFDDFPATVEVQTTSAAVAARREVARDDVLDEVCPTNALRVDEETPAGITVDRGACIQCGRCVQTYPEVFAWRHGADVATLSRRSLAPRHGVVHDREVEAVRADLGRRVAMLKRSVHIRHVDLGSDGSDEWEVQALLNPVYDIHRLGIFFTASPRHADILLVTGIGAHGMWAPLARTRDTMPDPVVVIAAGTDAVNGGLFERGYASSGGVGDLLEVDVWIPGSPPSPFSLLHGILLALDRVPAAGARSPRTAEPGRGSRS